MQNNEEYSERQLNTRALSMAGASFSLAAIIPVLVSLIFMLVLSLAAGEGVANSDWYKYFSFLVPPVCIAGVSVFFFRKTKVPPREIYAPCKWYWFVVALVLQFGVLFSLSELNEYFVHLLELIGYTRTNEADMLPTLGGWNLLPALLVIAVLPALFEETLFRGILVGRMQRSGWGTWCIALVSGALFSLFHTNPEQTVYQFVCGVCFALVALRAGSALPTIVAHFANNALILVLTSCGYGNFTALPHAAYLALIILSAVCLAGAALFLILFERKKNVRGKAPDGKKFFLMASFGIAVCALEWLTLFIERMV